MSAAKTAEDTLRPCINAVHGCPNITRPARRKPLASVQTVIRQGGGRCAKCYAADRRAESAKNPKPRPETPRPEQVAASVAHAAAGLDRMLAERRARLARQGRA